MSRASPTFSPIQNIHKPFIRKQSVAFSTCDFPYDAEVFQVCKGFVNGGRRPRPNEFHLFSRSRNDYIMPLHFSLHESSKVK